MATVNHPEVKALFRVWAPMTREDRAAAKRDLADAAGVDYSTVTKWTNGTSCPTSDRYQAIADATGHDVEEVAFACDPASRRAADHPAVSLEQHLALARKVQELAARVEDLGAELARWKRAGAQGSG